VQRGQILAEVGDSNDAQEPHLDLEVNPTSPNGRSKSRGIPILESQVGVHRFQLGVLRLIRLALPLDVGHASRRGTRIGSPTVVRNQSATPTARTTY
jgi:hypothetical protein